jgi:hypothetical protein
MKPIKTGKLAEEADLKKDIADDVTRKKIKKHLSDINDVITEEDIRNVKVLGKKSKKEKTKKTDGTSLTGEKDTTDLTSWNILEK